MFLTQSNNKVFRTINHYENGQTLAGIAPSDRTKRPEAAFTASDPFKRLVLLSRRQRKIQLVSNHIVRGRS